MLVNLLLVHLDHLYTIVITTLLAHMVRQPHLVALRARRDRGLAKFPMGTALATARTRYLLFWHCHSSLHLLILEQQLIQYRKWIVRGILSRVLFIQHAATIFAAQEADGQG